ncbi:phosphoribosylaminoimidazole carboxylase [Tanacetum coccineum]
MLHLLENEAFRSLFIIAVGGATHLLGMVAAFTPLHMIGVLVRASTLDGLDSLLSIVQIPRGVPIAKQFGTSTHLYSLYTSWGNI